MSNILAKPFVETNVLIDSRAAGQPAKKPMGLQEPSGLYKAVRIFQSAQYIWEEAAWQPRQETIARSIIVADDELMVLLGRLAPQKMELVEAKLIQLRLQGSLPSATGADASGATRAEWSAPQSTARIFAMKAVDSGKGSGSILRPD